MQPCHNGHDTPAEQHVVNVCNDKVRVVQLHIQRNLCHNHTTETTDDE